MAPVQYVSVLEIRAPFRYQFSSRYNYRHLILDDR